MENKYKIGDIIEGHVSGIEKYGIFVKLDDNYSGLVHISEISDNFVLRIENYASLDEIIYCRILEIDEDNKHMKLSIKNINYKSVDENNPIKETRKGFLPLKENLDKWLEEKIEIYK